MTTFRRVATRAAMYNTARTVARPPCTQCRPRRVPESRLSGATPTSFAISRRESRPSSGRSTSSVSETTRPTPGTLWSTSSRWRHAGLSRTIVPRSVSAIRSSRSRTVMWAVRLFRTSR